MEIELLKFKEIRIRRPYFDPNPQKSKTNNHKWRQGLFIVFVNNWGKEYIYMPKWSELEEINKGQVKVEEDNKKLASLWGV